jgi:uncharacterized protein YbjT (DUF2867 family)
MSQRLWTRTSPSLSAQFNSFGLYPFHSIMSSSKIFVIGATGAQGGAVARALLRNNYAVNALVRDPASAASQALKSQGASLFQGDWDNIPALEAAAAGCTGLFLNVYPRFEDFGAEVRHANNILTASKGAGIKQVVYASAIGVDRYETFHEVEPEGFFANYYRSKRTIEEDVQNGDFETWTILRGVIFMTNYLLPSSTWMFPELPAEGRFITAYSPDTKLLLVDPEDIGAFGFAAFSNPEKFGGKGIDVAAELVGVQEMTKAMEKVSGKKFEVIFHTEEEIEAQKDTNLRIMSQLIMRKTPPWVRLEEVRAWGVPLNSFEQFLEKEKDLLQRSIGERLN